MTKYKPSTCSICNKQTKNRAQNGVSDDTDDTDDIIGNSMRE
jgi:hypothetical protein